MKSRDNELDWVERLAHTMVEHQLYKLEFETEDVSLSLRAARRQPEPQSRPMPGGEGEAPEVEEADVVLIRSKDVGLFRPAPKLKAGSSVARGQTVAVVEAVSVEHDVVSQHQGVLVEILVQDGDPVEYGQPLFVISESEA